MCAARVLCGGEESGSESSSACSFEQRWLLRQTGGRRKLSQEPLWVQRPGLILSTLCLLRQVSSEHPGAKWNTPFSRLSHDMTARKQLTHRYLTKPFDYLCLHPTEVAPTSAPDATAVVLHRCWHCARVLIPPQRVSCLHGICSCRKATLP